MPKKPEYVRERYSTNTKKNNTNSGKANSPAMIEPILFVPYTPTIDLTHTLQPWTRNKFLKISINTRIYGDIKERKKAKPNSKHDLQNYM